MLHSPEWERGEMTDQILQIFHSYHHLNLNILLCSFHVFTFLNFILLNNLILWQLHNVFWMYPFPIPTSLSPNTYLPDLLCPLFYLFTYLLTYLSVLGFHCCEKISCLTGAGFHFRSSVCYGRKHDSVQADMVLEKELRGLHSDLQTARRKLA